MNKKLVSILLLISFCFSSLAFASTGAVGIAKDRASKVGPYTYKVIPTKEEQERSFERFGLDKSKMIRFNDSFIGKIADYNLYKVEKDFDDTGKLLTEIKYYRATYKNTPEANNVKNVISEQQQLGTTVVAMDSNLNSDISLLGYALEGDLRVVVSYKALSNTGLFDTETGYKETLEKVSYTKGLEFLSGTFTSNPVLNLFLSVVFDDIIDGYKGKGDGTSKQREVYKYGQAYHSGAWKTYFETKQDEVYWDQEEISYYSNGQVKNIKTTYFTPNNGYKPIEWQWMHYFDDNQEILDVTQYWYSKEPNLSTPIHATGYEASYYSTNWKALGTVNY
ncbi:hypothetical protein MFMK1_003350 [Metallumcola ferriviriculae]|uniref:Uncharacterized protein n=1 Tax=Metallumcola ferriviriculae TaxID=3039180 RepID=A0AAU0UT81_9FIRM|nr:hypothetical protein MFMK1_003350 [Desulfitibacteraceae bacterium MK1]